MVNVRRDLVNPLGQRLRARLAVFQLSRAVECGYLGRPGVGGNGAWECVVRLTRLPRSMLVPESRASVLTGL